MAHLVGLWFVAHKADFDCEFINRELEKAGLKFRIPENRTICTLQMSSGSVGRASLSDVCDALGIDRTSRKKHGAMLGAELCAEVFRQLVFGRRVLPVSP